MGSRHVRGPLVYNTHKIVLAGDYAVVDESLVIVNKTAGASTQITLPPSVTGDGRREVHIVDGKGDAATNNITVVPSGSDTVNGGASVVFAVNNVYAVFVDLGGGAWASAVPTVSGAGAFTTVSLTGLLTESGADALTSLGTNQATALALTKEVNRVTAGAAATGVTLPLASRGLSIFVINSVANSIHVYGAGTDTVNDVATATGVVQPANSVVMYTCTTTAPAGKWYTEGTGTGYAGSNQTLNSSDSLTAVGTTQGGALALANAMNRVTSSAATAAPFNGVSLPASAPGLQIEVINSSANPIQVYGAGSDTVNGIAAATGISHGVGQIATYNCTTAGNWTVQFGQPQQAGIVALSANGAVAPHTPHTYVITKAGSLAALTLAAPTAGTDDGILITVTSDTAFAHTLTATGLLDTGSASVNVATFAAQKGASLTLMAYNGRWKTLSQVGITFS